MFLALDEFRQLGRGQGCLTPIAASGRGPVGSYARNGSLDNATATLTRPHVARTDVSVTTTSVSGWRWAAVAAFVLFSASE